MTDTYKGELKNVICYKMPKKLKSHLLLNDYKTNYLKWGKLNKIITSMYYYKKHSSATNNICFNFKNTCPSQMGENLYTPPIGVNI